ncbi:MAG: hypothetical protein ACOYJG_07050 [Prevotella sp.]|jgi:hypothetical protein
MKTFRYLIITAFLAVMICSCSEDKKAQGLVEDFMKDNMEDTVKLANVVYSPLDSTFKMNDSIVKVLQTEALHLPLYKKGITFTQKPTLPLKYINVKYSTENDTTPRQQTFYFDKELKGIVVVKNY